MYSLIHLVGFHLVHFQPFLVCFPPLWLTAIVEFSAKKKECYLKNVLFLFIISNL